MLALRCLYLEFFMSFLRLASIVELHDRLQSCTGVVEEEMEVAKQRHVPSHLLRMHPRKRGSWLST